MKIRIKFEKQGSMKFIGHLDVMRYFQKAMRRADVDIAYSEGYSPHQKMSFASPLGVGLTSRGEYFDIEANSTDSSDIMLERLNNAMVDGIRVLSYRQLPEDTKNAMSLVAAATYDVCFRPGYRPENLDLKMKFDEFMSQEVIEVLKTTKKSEKIVDIKPFILEYKVKNEDCVYFKLCAGSENNLKPELIFKAFYEFLGLDLGKFDIMCERLDIFGKDENDNYKSLEEYGVEI